MIENCHKNGLACDDNFPCKSVFGYLITEREKGLYDAYRAQLDYVAFYNMFLTGSVRVCLADPKSPVLPQLKEAFLARFPDFRENAYIRSMSKKHRLLTGLLLSGQYGAVAALMRLNDRLRNKNR